MCYVIRLQLQHPPLCSFTAAAAEAFSGGGWRWLPLLDGGVWDPRASSAAEGFCSQQFSLDFSPESRVDTKGNKCLSVPVCGLVDIDAS